MSNHPKVMIAPSPEYEKETTVCLPINMKTRHNFGPLFPMFSNVLLQKGKTLCGNILCKRGHESSLLE
jgi:hypothetical protein